MSDPTWNGTPTGPESVGNDTGNVDKIRDILFGTQMRDYDRRFATTEERLQREAANLREDLGRRMLATEQYLRSEIEALTASLKAEERERTQGVREAMEALAAMNRDLTARLATLSEQTTQQQRELRGLLMEAQRSLGDEMARRHDEMQTALRREASDLRDAKADRATLAGMLAEMAERLAGEPNTR
jgi:DNA anti-recombination protein RmuC